MRNINVCLTTMSIQQFSTWRLSSDNAEKVNLRDMKDNDTKIGKVYVDGNKHCPGKSGGYMPSSLGSRLISVGRQAVRK